MNNFRKVNENDILKDLFEIRDETLCNNLNNKNKKHKILLFLSHTCSS